MPDLDQGGTRKLEPLGGFDIPGRGYVWTAVEPNPPFELDERVEVDGRIGTIIGLERHPIAGGPKPGGKLGVMVRHD